MNKFWNFSELNGERSLRLEGPIDSDNFWGDAVTPQAFRDELNAGEGDITVWINSPGGSVFAAAEIYTMLKEYKGKVTVKIDALAASAASVVAMAGEKVLMSPTAILMVHDPMTYAMGNIKDMEKVINVLKEVKESIINAYQAKTNLSRSKIAQLMEDETWLNAKKAVELGFADEILFESGEDNGEGQAFSSRAMGTAIINRLIHTAKNNAKTNENSSRSGNTEEVLDEKVIEDTPDENVAEDKTEDTIILGLDGKTKDGSMPYELLRKQLEFLR